MSTREFIETLWWGRSTTEIVIKAAALFATLFGGGIYIITTVFPM